MMISDEILIERRADCGLILEKSYALDVAYDFLLSSDHVTGLSRTLNPIWGEDILHFDYKGTSVVALSAKGSPIAVNAVERIRRTGGKRIILVGTCGSTDERIADGTTLVARAAVRDEGVSQGYLDLRVPALASEELTSQLLAGLAAVGVQPIVGVAFTTDKRYREDSETLRRLNRQAGVVYVDMETSAVLLVSAYHGIRAAVVKVATDCAVKATDGELKGIFDRRRDFRAFVDPKLVCSLRAALEAFATESDSPSHSM